MDASLMAYVGSVPSEHQWYARRVCEMVGGGLKCVRNNLRNTLHFYFRDPEFGCHAESLTPGRLFCERDVFNAARAIKGHRLETTRAFEKQQEKQQHECAERRDKFMAAATADILPEAIKRYDYLNDRNGQYGARSVTVPAMRMFSKRRRKAVTS